MPSAAPRSITIGTLARRHGITVETVRYYERLGLLPAPPRSDGGQRRYRPEHHRRLDFIRRARSLGFSLTQIRTLVDMASGDYTCREVRDLALAHLESVRARKAELDRLERTLSAVAGRCDGTRGRRCAVMDVLLEGSAQERTEADS